MTQEKILIVEDEPRVAQALSRALSLPEGGGYHVDACGSGEEALNRLAQSQYDLLITDYRMPGMTGLELLGKCRETSPHTRSILITAFGSPQVQEMAYQLAVDAYLAKPFGMRSLVQAVQNTLKQKGQSIPALQPAVFSKDVLQSLRRRTDDLRKDVGAREVLLFDRVGQLLAESGAPNEFDAGAILALLGTAIAATRAVSNVLEKYESFDLHFHEGKGYEAFTTRVSDQLFLAVVIDKQGNGSHIGMVRLYLHRAVADLRLLLTDAEKEDPATLGAREPAAALEAASTTDESASDLVLGQPGTVISFEQASRLGLLNPNSPKGGAP